MMSVTQHAVMQRLSAGMWSAEMTVCQTACVNGTCLLRTCMHSRPSQRFVPPQQQLHHCRQRRHCGCGRVSGRACADPAAEAQGAEADQAGARDARVAQGRPPRAVPVSHPAVCGAVGRGSGERGRAGDLHAWLQGGPRRRCVARQPLPLLHVLAHQQRRGARDAGRARRMALQDDEVPVAMPKALQGRHALVP